MANYYIARKRRPFLLHVWFQSLSQAHVTQDTELAAPTCLHCLHCLDLGTNRLCCLLHPSMWGPYLLHPTRSRDLEPLQPLTCTHFTLMPGHTNFLQMRLALLSPQVMGYTISASRFSSSSAIFTSHRNEQEEEKPERQ